MVLNIADSALRTNKIISGIFWLAMFFPIVGVMVRRLHDIGKSGWWILITTIPLIGIIYLLLLMARKSSLVSNVATVNQTGNTVNKKSSMLWLKMVAILIAAIVIFGASWILMFVLFYREY